MKKLFCGTSSLVGMSVLGATAADAQQGFELSVSGFMNAYQGFIVDYNDSDGRDQISFPFYHDSTINFIATQTLDNGVEAGARFELESSLHPGDEQWLWLRGNFGSFEMGWVNSAGFRMSQRGPDYVGVPINTGWVTAFVPAPSTMSINSRSVSFGTLLDIHDDVYTVAYFSPRFAGFQVGASFTPFLAGKGATVGSANNSTAQSFVTASNSNDRNTEWHSGWSVGLNFIRSFDTFDLALSTGYNRAEAPKNGLAGKDQEQYMVGGNIEVAGFTGGGSYAKEISSLRTDGHAWEVAGAYAKGAHSLSIAYLRTEYSGSILGDGQAESWEAIKGAYEHALAAGIEVSATLMYANWEDDSDNPTGQDQDGVAFVLGTTFTF